MKAIKVPVLMDYATVPRRYRALLPKLPPRPMDATRIALGAAPSCRLAADRGGGDPAEAGRGEGS
jgi:hypothetical protein